MVDRDKQAEGIGRPAETPSLPARRRRRRWLWTLLAVLVGLVVLAGFLPTLVSTGAGTGLIVSIVNSQIQGRVDIESLRLSWFSPVEVRGLSIYDRLGRQVLRVDRVGIGRSLGQLLLAWERFGRIEVQSPEAVLYLQESGTTSLAEALQPRRAAKPAGPPGVEAPPAGPLPSPQGGLTLRDGRLRVVRPDGQELGVHHLHTQIDLDSLNHISAVLEATLTTGGAVKVDLKAQNLAAAGRIDPGAAALDLKAETTEPIDLGRLGGTAEQSGLRRAGRLRFQASFGTRDRAGTASLSAGVAGLVLAPEGHPEVQPLTLDLKADLSIRSGDGGGRLVEEVAGRVRLDGDGVRLASDLTCRPGAGGTSLSVDDWLAALLEGEPLELPELMLKTDAAVDLARVSGAMPALLPTRRGLRLTSGKLSVERVLLQAGRAPCLRGRLRLTDLAGRQAEASGRAPKEVQWEPIRADFDLALEPKVGVQVRSASIETPFGSIHGAGTPRQITLKAEADLARLADQAGRLVDLSGLTLAGTLGAQATLRRDQAEEFQATVQAAVENLAYGSADRRLTLRKTTLELPVKFLRKGHKLVQAELPQGRVVLNDTLLAEFQASYTVQEQRAVGQLKLLPVEVAAINGLMQDLGLPRPERLADYGGRLGLSATFDVREGGQRVHLALDGWADDLRAGGKPLVAKRVVLRVPQASWDAAARQVGLSADLKAGKLLAFRAEGVEAALGPALSAKGAFQLQADLAGCLAAVEPLAGWSKRPEISGTLSWSGQAHTRDGAITYKAEARLADLAVGAGQEPIRPGEITLSQAAIVDTAKELVRIEKMTLASKPLSAAVSGTIAQYRQQRVLDLAGRYEGSWDFVTAVLHQLAPGSAEAFALAGQSSGEFVVRGPAHEATIEPVYREVQAGTELGWLSGRLLGMELGQARLKPELKKAGIHIPVTAVPASGGTLRLGGTVDLVGGAPTYRLPGRTTVIEHVRVNPEISRQLLSRVNPIFGQVAEIEGTITLVLNDVTLPLGQETMKSASLSGRLELTDFRLKASGFLAKLLDLGGLVDNTMHKVVISGLEFVVKDGRLVYRDFRLTFGSVFDLVFRGSVGLDGSVELWVSIPVLPSVLKKYGVTGPIDQIAQVLADQGIRLEIPIAGTRLGPELGQVDVLPLVEKAAKSLLTGEALKQGAETLIKLPGAAATQTGKTLRQNVETLLRLPGAVASQVTTRPTEPTPKTDEKAPSLFDRLLPGKKPSEPDKAK